MKKVIATLVIESIGGDLYLQDNPDLTDVSGVANMEVGGSLIRFDNRNEFH